MNFAATGSMRIGGMILPGMGVRVYVPFTSCAVLSGSYSWLAVTPCSGEAEVAGQHLRVGHRIGLLLGLLFNHALHGEHEERPVLAVINLGNVDGPVQRRVRLLEEFGGSGHLAGLLPDRNGKDRNTCGAASR